VQSQQDQEDAMVQGPCNEESLGQARLIHDQGEKMRQPVPPLPQ
jgi:hypothetical protein